jgi:hypothetical protein
MAVIINASTSTGLVQSADTSGVITLQNNGTNAVTVDSGNVGIGTTSPAFKTEIVGGATTVETTLLQIRSNAGGINTGTTIALANSTSTTAGSGRVEIAGLRDTASGSSFVIRTADSGGTIQNRMKINESGTVLLGTTSTSSFDGGFRAVPTGSGNSMQVIISNTGGGLPFLLNRSDDGNIIDFRRAGTNVGAISVTTTNTAYNTSSDYRLKENITPMTSALAKVTQLKPCTYTWKANGSSGQGFIAHELQAVIPDSVTGVKDAVDAEGSPVYQGVDTSYLVATLTAAIQELKAIVDAQAVRIAELEGAK